MIVPGIFPAAMPQKRQFSTVTVFYYLLSSLLMLVYLPFYHAMQRTVSEEVQSRASPALSRTLFLCHQTYRPASWPHRVFVWSVPLVAQPPKAHSTKKLRATFGSQVSVLESVQERP